MEWIIVAVAIDAKPDPSFRPRLDVMTTRWHVTGEGGQFEILLTGARFWDSRDRKGGGGAVDLVMHLDGAPFKTAVRKLLSLRI